MKILFVTGLYPRAAEAELRSHCTIVPSAAPNVLQWAIIEGLKQNGADFKVVSYPFLPSYPHGYKKAFTFDDDIELDGEKIGEMRRYTTIPGIKPESIKQDLTHYIYNWIERMGIRPEEKFAILTYMQLDYFVEPAVKAKEHFPNMVLGTIVTDLTEDLLNPVNKPPHLLKRWQIQWNLHCEKQLYKDIDRFFLIAKDMTEYIPEAVGKSIVMEGIATPKGLENVERQHKTLLYTGHLPQHACIRDLVDAFMQTTDPDFRLVICGSGDEEGYVKEKAEEDKRIVFKGIVSHEEAIRLQKTATAVINPRKPDISLTKYSFPSKTMEYLASGTPMTGYRLEGIPEEYYTHFYTVDAIENEALTTVINKVLTASDTELREKALAAYRFISEKKNPKTQTARIIDFLNK